MTTRNLAIRLSVTEGGKVKAELREVGEVGEKSLRRIELAGKPASKSLLALNAAANDVRGAVDGLASRVGPLGSALGALGPAGVLAAAALAAVSLGMVSSLQNAAEAEQSFNRLQAVLKATGSASGLSATQIAAMADSIEASTLATAEQVQDAASVLATFRSVAGDTFTRAMRLAQDMSSVFGQDLRSTVTQLGKALEEPVQGLTALRRVGVSFTQSQKDLIASLVETGQTAEAQKVILDALEQQVGGAGAAEASGLRGATNRLSDAWGNLLEDIGQTGAVAGTAQSALNGLSSVLENMRGLLADDTIADKISDAQLRLVRAKDRLEKLQNYKPILPFVDMGRSIARQSEEVNTLRSELNQLVLEADKEQQQAAAEQRKLDDAREAAAKERRADLLNSQSNALTETLDRLASNPAEKIARINRELETTRKKLNALKESDGSNSEAIASALAKAEEIAQRQIAAIEKPAHQAASRLVDTNRKVIDDLQRQMLGTVDKRQAFIEQAVSRLSAKASASQISQTKQLAAQLFDTQALGEVQKVIADIDKQMTRLTDKRQAFIDDIASRLPQGVTAGQRQEVESLAAALYDQGEAQQRLNQLQQEGESLTRSLRTAAQVYADEQARLNSLLEAGTISQATYTQALAQAEDQYLQARTDAQAGAIRAFKAYQKQGEDAASAVEQAFTNAMKATEDAIVNLVTSGGASLKSLGELANSVIADITRMMVQKSITGPLFEVIGGSFTSGGFLDGILGSLFHTGGEAGTAAPQRLVPSRIFADAPRYHTGGIAGLKPNEIPAILERGEVILPKDKATRAPSTQPVNVIMNITTPDANSFRLSQSQLTTEAARGIQRARRNL